MRADDQGVDLLHELFEFRHAIAEIHTFGHATLMELLRDVGRIRRFTIQHFETFRRTRGGKLDPIPALLRRKKVVPDFDSVRGRPSRFHAAAAVLEAPAAAAEAWLGATRRERVAKGS